MPKLEPEVLLLWLLLLLLWLLLLLLLSVPLLLELPLLELAMDPPLLPFDLLLLLLDLGAASAAIAAPVALPLLPSGVLALALLLLELLELLDGAMVVVAFAAVEWVADVGVEAPLQKEQLLHLHRLQCEVACFSEQKAVHASNFESPV